MISQQTLANYYAAQEPLVSVGDQPGRGHFQAWRLEDFLADLDLMGIYSRKDLYKLTLTTGPATYCCADREFVLAPGEPALVFTNTQVPYGWHVPVTAACRGFCCVFTDAFIPAYARVRPADWPVFALGGVAFFRLTTAQATYFEDLFAQIIGEQQATHLYTYELRYHLLMTGLYAALKLEPAAPPLGNTAALRLTKAFNTLLASQYPIVSPARRLILRTPQTFADVLAVHVNHLNRTLKAVTGKTTT